MSRVKPENIKIGDLFVEHDSFSGSITARVTEVPHAGDTLHGKKQLKNTPVAWMTSDGWSAVTKRELDRHGPDHAVKVRSFFTQPLYLHPPLHLVFRDISTAPMDGNEVNGINFRAQTPTSVVTKFENGKWLSRNKDDKFVVPGWSQWWPTHWISIQCDPTAQPYNTSL